MTEEKKDQNPQVLNPQQAINILVQGVNLGQKAGVYSLDDAAIIKQAVDVFVKKDENKETKQKMEVVKKDTPEPKEEERKSETPTEVEKPKDEI